MRDMKGRAARDHVARQVRIRLLFALLGLAVVEGAVRFLAGTWTAYDPNEYRERLDSCRRQPWDLVLIGGSPMAEGVDPARLAGLYWHGATLNQVFNLGLAGATTSAIWHALEHAAVAPPRLVVYGITASDLNDNRDEPNGVWSFMDVADVAEWLQRRPDQGEWCVRHFVSEHLARLWQLHYYRNGIRLWAADHLGPWWPGTSPQALEQARYGLQFSAALRRGNGFAPRVENKDRTLAQLRANGLIEARFRFLEHYRLGGHLQYLHRILDWAAERGVAVVLLDMPVVADLEALYPKAFAVYRAALAEVERSRGVPVLRPSREAVGLSEEDFADRVHLNARGTERLSVWLRDRLAGLGSLGREEAHERH
jgi:hypothetical protein